MLTKININYQNNIATMIQNKKPFPYKNSVYVTVTDLFVGCDILLEVNVQVN